MSDPLGIVAVPYLTPEQASEVSALVRVCREYDGISGMLHDAPVESVVEGETNQFLYYVDGMLAGILTLPYGKEIEMLGMVHPDYRRQGIGRALLEAGTAEGRRRGVATFLLVCEDAADVGRAFAEAMRGVYRFAEHRLKLDPTLLPPPSKRAEKITLVRADAADQETLVHLEAASFDDSEERSATHIPQWLTESNQRFYMGQCGGQPVGLIRVASDGESVDLCTFGVLPEFRGRGLGRQILEQVIQNLLPEGKTIYIEVETENKTALSLYLSSGFQSVATFRYYEFLL